MKSIFFWYDLYQMALYCVQHLLILTYNALTYLCILLCNLTTITKTCAYFVSVSTALDMTTFRLTLFVGLQVQTSQVPLH